VIIGKKGCDALTLVSLDKHVFPGEDTLFYAGHSLFGGAEGIQCFFI